jgi:hypothetical protein
VSLLQRVPDDYGAFVSASRTLCSERSVAVRHRNCAEHLLELVVRHALQQASTPEASEAETATAARVRALKALILRMAGSSTGAALQVVDLMLSCTMQVRSSGVSTSPLIASALSNSYPKVQVALKAELARMHT